MNQPNARWLDGLSPAQKEVATYATGPQLVTAGPGSGKTKTLCAWISELLAQDLCRPKEILAVTFTRRAAGELRERLSGLLGPLADALLIGTFHHFSLALVPLVSPLRLAEESERLQFVEEARVGSGCRKSPASLLSLLSLRKGQHPDYPDRLARGDLDVSPDELVVFQRYAALCAQHNVLDLDDLLLRALASLRSGLTSPLFRFVAVDEYQDVSAVQRALTVELGKTATVLAIGDPDQAIYAFRGGEVRHFRDFVTDFPAAQVRYLCENYRSTAEIVGAASAVIVANPGRTAPPPVPCRPAGGKIQLLRSPSLRSEAVRIVHEIERLIGGSSLSLHDRRLTDLWRAGSYGFSDIAILTRTIARADAVAEALHTAGLPFSRPSKAQTPLSALPDASPPPNPVWECDHLEDQRIAVLTLHGSKGLEFPVVFVVGLEASVIPGPGRDDDQREEERRLFFVGMTRAKDHLYLSRIEADGCAPCPFLSQVPAELTESEAPKKPNPQKPQLRLF
ncbi:MAG TPA: ATP-dependent helicase [Pseudomonadota bacterium]|nr:ATP-dependent helicase [Pseudomonadota bacterium]